MVGVKQYLLISHAWLISKYCFTPTIAGSFSCSLSIRIKGILFSVNFSLTLSLMEASSKPGRVFSRLPHAIHLESII